MKSLLSLLFLAVNIQLSAQIVNIENQRLSDNKQGFSGSVELNFNFTMNSKQLLQIGDKVSLGYVKNRHQLLIVTDHSFIKSEGEDFANKGFQHFRYNYTFKDSGKVSIEAFQQGQFNKIQKIKSRLLMGAGLRFKLIDQKKYQLNLGSGFMGEYEALIDNGVSEDILSTSYLSFDAQFSKSVGMNTISYFQPKLIAFGNYRFSNETSIRFKINKYLTFRVVYSLTHDNRDIPEVRKTNYVIKNALQFQF